MSNGEESPRTPNSGVELQSALRAILLALARGRCYACDWPLHARPEEGCSPFNCSMRYSEHNPEYPYWLKRAHEMQDVLVCFTSASSPFAVSETITPEEIALLREIRHRAWHVMEGSEENAQTGEFSIEPSEDLSKLIELLGDAHP